ncbi:MAG TPA: outer membrane beta-barrel protein [Polyangiaceae bacterium]|nr:outer membrane beta-barrel protein [Polyangiaceae bacterium]
MKQTIRAWGASGIALFVSLAPPASAQTGHRPTTGFPLDGQPGSSPPAPPGWQPVPAPGGAPATQGLAPSGASPSPAPGATPGEREPAAPPSPGYAPGPPPYGPPPGSYAPAPWGSAPGYGPPPGVAPVPYGEPEPSPAEPTPAAGALSRGLYFGARLGVGGPFGGNTTYGYSEGVGVLAEAGYAFLPYFGANLFLHWNHSSLVLGDTGSASLAENSGHVLLYGVEARGILPMGQLAAWASLGVALGSGSFSVKTSQNGGFGTSQSTTEGSVDANPMPVLGFGAEYELVPGFYVGPEARWYVLSASKACQKETPDFFGTGERCTSEFSKVTVPDILFLGVGATYRYAL